VKRAAVTRNSATQWPVAQPIKTRIALRTCSGSAGQASITCCKPASISTPAAGLQVVSQLGGERQAKLTRLPRLTLPRSGSHSALDQGPIPQSCFCRYDSLPGAGDSPNPFAHLPGPLEDFWISRENQNLGRQGGVRDTSNRAFCMADTSLFPLFREGSDTCQRSSRSRRLRMVTTTSI
jgi:hypothetical protein